MRGLNPYRKKLVERWRYAVLMAFTSDVLRDMCREIGEGAPHRDKLDMIDLFMRRWLDEMTAESTDKLVFAKLEAYLRG